MPVKVLKYPTLQEAWEGLNEYMVLDVQDVLDRGGVSYGTQIVSFANHIVISKAWVDPEFDFGYVLGYTIKKWSALLNNYLDLTALELIRTEIAARVEKNSPAYNYTMHFTNSHLSGKDCLISLTFSKRPNVKHPIVTFHARVAELTKRVIFDFLLVQRMVEFVYGHNDVEVHYSTPSFYLTAEGFAMYNNHKDIKKLFKARGIKKKDLLTYQARVIKKLEEYSTVDPDTISYKVNKRTALQLQRDADGKPLSGKGHLYAKDCTL